MKEIIRPILYFSLALIAVLILILVIVGRNQTDRSKLKIETIDIVDDPLVEFAEGRKHFNIQCAMCHILSAKSTPDLLYNLNLKMNSNYFHLYITRQDSLINANDDYALKSFAKFESTNLTINHTFDLTNYESLEIYEYILATNSR